MKLLLTMTSHVSELKNTFNEAFGARLRVYVGRSQVEDATPLAAAGLKQAGVFECEATLTVAEFIKRMSEEFGLKVKVMTCDEWVTVLDGLTLELAGKVGIFGK